MMCVGRGGRGGGGRGGGKGRGEGGEEGGVGGGGVMERGRLAVEGGEWWLQEVGVMVEEERGWYFIFIYLFCV